MHIYENDFEMLQEHGIQRSHAHENVFYDAIARLLRNITRSRISRFSCYVSQQQLLQIMWLQFCVVNKSDLYNFTFYSF